MKPTNKWLTLLVVGIGSLMLAYDLSSVNTILPIIAKSFQADISQIEWVVTSGFLVISGLLIIFGRLGDMLGHRTVFRYGLITFVTFSVFSALAPSLNILILTRSFQALGVSMISSNTPALLTKAFPSSERGKAMGYWGTITYIGLILGPFTSGWLAEVSNWRVVFLFSIPFGITSLILSRFFLPKESIRTDSQRFDYIGAVTFMLGILGILFVLNQMHNYSLSSPLMIFLLGAGTFFLILFFLIEKASANPMMDLNQFKNRTFSIGFFALVTVYLCVYSIIFLIPFYFLNGLGLGPSQTGMLLAIMSAFMAITVNVSGNLSDRVGTKLPMIISIIIGTLSLFFLSLMDGTLNYIHIIGALALAGAGYGAFFSPNTSAILGSAPEERQGTASGMLATGRTLGMVLGVGVAGFLMKFHMNTNSESPTDIQYLQSIPKSFVPFIFIGLITLFVVILLYVNLESEEDDGQNQSH